jgi:propionyl-CoA carboxylase alpha chain
VPDAWVVRLDGREHAVAVRPMAGGHEVRHAGRDYAVRSDWQFGQPLFRGSVNGVEHCMQVERRGLGYQLFQGGGRVDALVLTPRVAQLHALMPEKQPADLSGFLLSPMPGLLLSLSVQAGDAVKSGQELAVVEAMKMENVLRADRDQVVKDVLAQPGDSLAVDQKILEFE